MLQAINDLSRHIASLSNEFHRAIETVLNRGWFVLGPEVEEFEREFAAYCGSPHCIGVANGTDALELALRALGVQTGEVVVTVANAGMYGTTAIRAVGARPLYVDIDPLTLNLDPNDLERVLTSLSQPPKALILTHLYGLLADLSGVLNLTSRFGIAVVEDCAQAHGAELMGRRAGTWGSVGGFSFYPTKNLGTLGDGGALVTADLDLAARLRQLRQYGWENKYRATLAGGRNSRLDELQAALLRVQLPLLDNWNRRRRAIAQAYSQGIRHSEVITPAVLDQRYVGHLYVIRCARRDSLREHIKARGIPTDVHYPVPDYRQPAYASEFLVSHLPNTELACAEVLTLPCFPEMTDTEVEHVIAAVNSWRP